ncbi:1-phosphofructokinase family hexose kinase [Amycolatopsis nigrescens]|uniref:1-phosphofructokinase family hexose kinase n=1 Tax=Amycolatopsis nigrescens TaxID=381445 RepID=UPI00035C369D|nr:hexose kinase [Amycolatopsis nigrescens]
MILTVTPNTALDVTYTLDRLVPDRAHRASRVDRRAGGKGVNVARVLHTLGVTVCAAGTAGGPDGESLRADLAAAGIRHELVAIGANSRRTTTLVSTMDKTVTLLNEPGAELTEREWAALTWLVERLAPAASVLVCSGSLPPGAPADGYARLLGAAAGPSVLDTSGDALLAGLAARPSVVKPNLAELLEVTGIGDPRAAAAALREGGAGAVLVSLGEDGLLASTADGEWLAKPSEVLTGNPTGAGDAAVAGIALELARGAGWPAVLRRAVALSAAAVLGQLAGDVDLAHYRSEHHSVTVTQLDGP